MRISSIGVSRPNSPVDHFHHTPTMAKQRKQKSAGPSHSQPSSKSAPLSGEIPESEQWRIIEETGLLKKIPRPDSQPAAIPQQQRSKSSKPEGNTEGAEHEGDDDDDPFSPFCNEVFNAICFTIPFSSLYVMMDVYAPVVTFLIWTCN